MTKTSPRPTPEVPVSWGELIDKITILEIKGERMSGGARDNVLKELAILRRVVAPVAESGEIANLKVQLKTINEKLWDVEDRLREMERARRFDDEFVALARGVYANNDARAALKRRISIALGSEILEEKSYDGKPSE